MLRKSGKNQLAEHTMSHLKTWKILVKSLHFSAENSKNSENFNFPHHDFDIFLPYSLNKKRRWEMEFMSEIEKIQSTSSENLTVLFLERTCIGSYQYLRYLETTLPGQFRIRAVHSISEEHFYEKTDLNSIFGQDFRNFSDKSEELSENCEKSGVVAYNFIEPPKNFMKIFAKKCISKKNMDSPYTSGWIRKSRQKEIRRFLKFYEIIDFSDENFEEFGHEFAENFENFAEKPRQKWFTINGSVAEYRASEGKTITIPYRGDVNGTVQDILGGIRSACTYTGSKHLKELAKRATFIRVTQQTNDMFVPFEVPSVPSK